MRARAARQPDSNMRKNDMSNGRNPTDNDADVEFIASKAAELVAAGENSRTDAIKLVVQYLRDDREADGDETGTKGVELKFPKPSREVPIDQVRKIKSELMDAARDAADEI
jgi:hypothetical protein